MSTFRFLSSSSTRKISPVQPKPVGGQNLDTKSPPACAIPLRTTPVDGAMVVPSEGGGEGNQTLSSEFNCNPFSGHFFGAASVDMTTQLNKPSTNVKFSEATADTPIRATSESVTRVVSRPQLRLVEDAPTYVEEIRCQNAEFHSLHDLDVEQTRMHPLLARGLIERFSSRCEVVLDPSARFGTAALEAALLEREAKAAEIHPVLASICGAKISPADIAEVALMCQTIGLRRPVGIESFHEHFSAHYEVETYRELVMLRSLLGDSQSRVDNCVRALSLSLMHGPSAGYFSVPAPVATALSTDEQHAFNLHRKQRPDYRAILPRLLKRAAGTTRDGLPSFAVRARRKTIGTLLQDPRRLESVETESVDFVLTEPRLPQQAVMPGDQSWLRNWFIGAAPTSSLSVDAWLAHMNESLLEWARVLKAGRKAALVLGTYVGEESPELVVAEMVRKNLGRFFAVEGIIIERARADVVRGSRTRSFSEEIHGTARILVLKRR